MNGDPVEVRYAIKMDGEIQGGLIYRTKDEARDMASTLQGDWRIVEMVKDIRVVGWKEKR